MRQALLGGRKVDPRHVVSVGQRKRKLVFDSVLPENELNNSKLLRSGDEDCAVGGMRNQEVEDGLITCAGHLQSGYSSGIYTQIDYA